MMQDSDSFEKKIRQALNLMQKKNLQELGVLLPTSFFDATKVVAQKDISDLENGRFLRDLITSIIEHEIRDSGEFPFQIYDLLHLHILEKKDRYQVCSEMNISEQTFYKLKRDSIRILTDLLLRLGKKDGNDGKEQAENNLPDNPPYQKFIERKDPKSKKLWVDIILDYLSPCFRSWVIAIDGIGGIGKTSLAYEVAWRCCQEEKFSVVVWASAKMIYIDHNGREFLKDSKTIISSLNDVLNVIVNTFRLPKLLKLPKDKKEGAVLSLLSQHHSLVIIDNLESLSQDHYNDIHEFVKLIPHPSKVLLTSRRRDHIGENVISLQGMCKEESFEFISNEIDLNTIVLSTENINSIIEISRGIPLAIKYILGQVRTFGQMIVGHLANDHENQDYIEDLLSFIFRDSYNLICEEERLLLHTISIFVSSAYVDEICAASGYDYYRLNKNFRRLYTLFLVKDEGDKVSLVELNQNFLAGLAKQNEHLALFREEARERLAEYYKGFNSYYSGFKDHKYVDALESIRLRKENILCIMEWCHKSNNDYRRWTLFLSLFDLVSHELSKQSQWADRLKWAEIAVDIATRMRDHKRVAWHRVYDLAYIYWKMNQPEKSRKQLLMALEDLKLGDDLLIRALALRNLASIERDEQKYEAAKDLYLQSIKILEELNDELWISHALNGIGKLCTLQANYHDAEIFHKRSLQYRRSINEIPGIILSLSNLGSNYIKMGDLQLASNCLDEALQLAKEHNYDVELAHVLVINIHLLVAQKNKKEIVSAVDYAIDLCTRLGLNNLLDEINMLSVKAGKNLDMVQKLGKSN